MKSNEQKTSSVSQRPVQMAGEHAREHSAEWHIEDQSTRQQTHDHFKNLTIPGNQTGEVRQRRTAPNQTGLPDTLKNGVEHLSGYSMDAVRVHYNSSMPARYQAHAFAQGTDIHLASGQEKHLAHEAWHVVQQQQGRVKPTGTLAAGPLVNDDPGLEQEADQMGHRANEVTQRMAQDRNKNLRSLVRSSYVMQPKWAGLELETNIPIFHKGSRPDHVDGYLHPPPYNHTNVAPAISAEMGPGFEIHIDGSEDVRKGTFTVCKGEGKPSIMEIITPPAPDQVGVHEYLAQVKGFLNFFRGQKTKVDGDWLIGWPVAQAPPYQTKERSIPVAELNVNLKDDADRTDPFHYKAQITFQTPVESLEQVNRKELFREMESRGRPVEPSEQVKLKRIIHSTIAPVAGVISGISPASAGGSIKLAMLIVQMLNDTLDFLQDGPGTIKNSLSRLVRSDLRVAGQYFKSGPEARSAEAGEIAKQLKPIMLSILPPLLEADDRPTELLKGTGKHDEESHVTESLKRGVSAGSKGVSAPVLIDWWAAEVRRLLIGPAPAEAEITGPLRGEKTLGEFPREHDDEPEVVSEERYGWMGTFAKHDRAEEEMNERFFVPHEFPEIDTHHLREKLEAAKEAAQPGKKAPASSEAAASVMGVHSPHARAEPSGSVEKSRPSSPEPSAAVASRPAIAKQKYTDEKESDMDGLKAKLLTALPGSTFSLPWPIMNTWFATLGDTMQNPDYKALVLSDKCDMTIEGLPVHVVLSGDAVLVHITVK